MTMSLNGADGGAFAGRELSVAMPDPLHIELSTHLGRHLAVGRRQEDLAFALWRPSHGRKRTTAILHRVILPEPNESVLQGNVAFTSEYLMRVLALAQPGDGISTLR